MTLLIFFAQEIFLKTEQFLIFWVWKKSVWVGQWHLERRGGVEGGGGARDGEGRHCVLIWWYACDDVMMLWWCDDVMMLWWCDDVMMLWWCPAVVWWSCTTAGTHCWDTPYTYDTAVHHILMTQQYTIYLWHCAVSGRIGRWGVSKSGEKGRDVAGCSGFY